MPTIGSDPALEVIQTQLELLREGSARNFATFKHLEVGDLAIDVAFT
jgi:hypothetical protein